VSPGSNSNRGSHDRDGENVGPVDARVVPRYAGRSTFARLPELDEVKRADVAIIGVPFDAGTSYRPGARFGPQAIRQASRMLRTVYDPAMDTEPLRSQQVVDGGDVSANPFSIPEALAAIEAEAVRLMAARARVIIIGGDHTITLGALRAVNRRSGPVALVHFDAHLDTWDTYFGARITHGSFLRRAAEEGLFLDKASTHVGIRGPLYDRHDLVSDAELGFRIVHCRELDEIGVRGVVEQIRTRAGQRPLYLSIDIDVLDPAHAPGTGTPELGGMTSRELLAVIQGLKGLNIVGADVVEVAPAYDHAEITSLAAATIVYKLISLLALTRPAGKLLEQNASRRAKPSRTA
jgi:guanidinobutyrase / D-arginase